MFDEIVDFLAQNYPSADDMKSLVTRAFPDSPQITSKIDYSGSPDQYVPRIVQRLRRYGKIPPDTEALWHLLLTAKNDFGFNIGEDIDTFRSYANKEAAPPLPTAPKPAIPLPPPPPKKREWTAVQIAVISVAVGAVMIGLFVLAAAFVPLLFNQPVPPITMLQVPTLSDTPSVTLIPEPTHTLTPTLELRYVVETYDANATLEQGTKDANATASARETQIVAGTQSSVNQTQTATLWTPVPTVNVTASLQAYLTQRGLEAMGTFVVGQTATARSWTATPTRTPDLIVIAHRTQQSETATAQSWTATPSMTLTLRPTNTPFPASELLNGVQVTFRDDFEGDNLSWRWGVWSTRPKLEEGQLIINGTGNWGYAVTRQAIEANEGILILFQVTQGTSVNLTLAKGEWESSGYRTWTLGNAFGFWDVVTNYGVRGSTAVSYARPILFTNTWYYLLHRIGNDGRFHTYVWPQYNPSRFVASVSTIPPTTGYDGRWEFLLQPHSGTVKVELYEELLFPENYEMPTTPPSP